MALLIPLAVGAVGVAAAREINRRARSDAVSTAAARDRLVVSQMAASGVHLAMALLVKDRLDTVSDSVQESWARPEAMREYLAGFAFDAGELSVEITDERSRIQVNALVAYPQGRQVNPGQYRIWTRFARQLAAGVELAGAADPLAIVDSLVDWLDRGDDGAVTGLGGAESDYYQALTPPDACRNGPIPHLGELARVKGVSPELLASVGGVEGVSRYLSVFGSTPAAPGPAYDGRININTADGGWRGPRSGSVTVEGRGFSPRTASAALTARLSASGLAAEGVRRPEDVELTLAAGLEAGTVGVQRLEVSAGPVSLSASGRLDLETEGIEARLALEAREVAGLAASPELAAIAGRIRVDAEAGGTLRQPQLRIALDGAGFRYRDVTLGDVALAAGLGPTGILQVSAFELKNRGSSVRAAGTVRIFDGGTGPEPARPLSLVLDLKNVRPEDFASLSPVDGRIDGRLTLSGSLSAPEAALSLTAGQLSIRQHRLGDVEAEAALAAGTLRIDRLRMTRHRSSLALSGTAALLDSHSLAPLDDPLLDLAFDSDGIDLADISPALAGHVTARGTLRGSMNHPLGSIEASGRGIDMGFQKIETVDLSIAMDGSRFQINRLAANLREKESVNATGWIRTDGGFALNLSSDGLSLDHLADGRLAETVSGRLRLDLKAGGTLKRPVLEGTASTVNLRLNGKAVEDAELTVRLAEDRLRLRGRLNFGIDAVLDLGRRDFSADLSFDRTELAPYFQAAGQPDLSGEVSGTVRAGGNLTTLKGLNAAADIERLRIDFKQTPVVETSDLRLSLVDKVLMLPQARLHLPGDSRLDISGSGRLDGPIDFGLKGKLPLSALRLVTDAVSDLTGHILVDGRVTGAAGSPRLAAELVVADAGLTVVALGQRIEAIGGRMEVTHTELRLSALKGKVGNGTFNLNGRMAVEDYRPGEAALQFDAAAIPIEIPGTLDMLISSRLTLSGTIEAAVVKGEISLLEGSYHKNVDLSLMTGIQSLATKRREVEAAPAAGQTPHLDRIALDIGITARHPFLVQNNLADLEIRPDMRLTGTLQDPILNGRSEIETGTVTYSKTVFDIHKGIIDFNNPYRIEPSFDLMSQAQVRDWLVTLTITGTPEALDFRLSSNPPLESADIGSLLLFGKTGQELAGGGGPGSGQSAANMLAELLAATYADDIKEQTGLDVFEFSAEKDSRTQEERITVAVGKEISERMTFKLATERKRVGFIQRVFSSLSSFPLCGKPLPLRDLRASSERSERVVNLPVAGGRRPDAGNGERATGNGEPAWKKARKKSSPRTARPGTTTTSRTPGRRASSSRAPRSSPCATGG